MIVFLFFEENGQLPSVVGELDGSEIDLDGLTRLTVEVVKTARVVGVVLGVAWGVDRPLLAVLRTRKIIRAFTPPSLTASRYLKLTYSLNILAFPMLS